MKQLKSNHSAINCNSSFALAPEKKLVYFVMFQMIQDPSWLAGMASISSSVALKQTIAPVCSLIVVKSLGFEVGSY